VKILKLLLVVFVALTMTSCSLCTKVEYIDVPYEVKVPVPCKVPETKCDFNQTKDSEVIVGLVECIVKLKRNQEVCR